MATTASSLVRCPADTHRRLSAYSIHTQRLEMRCVCVFLPLSVRTAQWDTRAPQRAVRLTLAVYFRSVFFRTMSRTRWLVQVLCSNSVASARSCSRVSAHTGRTFFRLLLILLLLVFSSRFLPSPAACASVSMCSVRAHCVFSPLFFLCRLVARG